MIFNFFCICSFFLIIDLLMQTQVLLCKSSQKKLENMENEPINSHIPYTHTHTNGSSIYVPTNTCTNIHTYTHIHIHKVGPLYATFTICLEMRVGVVMVSCHVHGKAHGCSCLITKRWGFGKEKERVDGRTMAWHELHKCEVLPPILFRRPL